MKFSELPKKEQQLEMFRLAFKKAMILRLLRDKNLRRKFGLKDDAKTDDFLTRESEKVLKMKVREVDWTYRTRDEIVNADWEDLNWEERMSRRTLKENPDMTLERADELLDMLP